MQVPYEHLKVMPLLTRVNSELCYLASVMAISVCSSEMKGAVCSPPVSQDAMLTAPFPSRAEGAQVSWLLVVAPLTSALEASQSCADKIQFEPSM